MSSGESSSMGGVAHRLRCVTIKAGIVASCSNCGWRWVTDWSWDFAQDPAPHEGPIAINSEQALAELAEIGSTVDWPLCDHCQTIGGE